MEQEATPSNRFDAKARKMDANPRIQGLAICFAEAVVAHVPLRPAMQALDYGCGSGLAGMQLAAQLGQLWMLDSSEGMLALLREKIAARGIANMRLIHGDSNAPALKELRFDLIYMSNVLHHIEDPKKLLTALYALVKPGGHICVGDLATEPGTFHEDASGVYHFGFSDQQLTDFLQASGFQPLGVKIYTQVNKPDSLGQMRSYPMLFAWGCKG